MPAKLLMELNNKTQERLTVQKASLFHGVMMELIDHEYASVLHDNSMRPYTQTIFKKDGKYYWQITTMTDEAKEKILIPILSGSLRSIELKHNDISVGVGKKHFMEESYQEIAERYFNNGDCSKDVSVRFVNPTAFKRDGVYLNYPDIYLVYNSIINRFNQFSGDPFQNDRELVHTLSDKTKISEYDLHSVFFSIERGKVNGFSGKATFHVEGDSQIVSLANMLFHFAEYSGIGMKTAIGMGTFRRETE